MAHPRWRGEHLTPPDWAAGVSGSSPLARGAHELERHFSPGVRLIPAGAGNTARTSTCGSATWAHPRWRGEHSKSGPALQQFGGSSPLARGAPLNRRRIRRGVRLIPAGAGSTSRGFTSCGSSTAHPRWRGEHSATLSYMLSRCGSSPLARGALVWKGAGGKVTRLIPAGAGNTEDGVASVMFGCGSSPLARGTQRHRHGQGCDDGLIPAGAGNTIPMIMGRLHTRAHPRWRGEHHTGAGAH